ncbi:DUF1648 domain-containing protein [Agromyces archimandritae]|uniref:DUF1648 domain-containing protein n=1 Tax=Agromyces archimandritae TaxID=2781962 RepID=A0A975INH3_9MICO|nr:DUF1648 domain-containing protein [Agromyces archimandritae]QTX04613.1 DUF1648 domain-containing protein [Agromyces archimandritae]
MTGPDRTVPRFLAAALGIPVVLIVAALVSQLLLLPQLPDPVAIHWGPSGAPDGFAPAWATPLTTLLAGLGLPALLALSVLPALLRGDRGPSYRFMGATAAGLAALLAVLGTGTLWIQAGLDDAANATGIAVPLIAGFVAAAAFGVLAWFIQPAAEIHRATAADATALELGGEERAVWIRETSMPLGAIIAIAATVLVIAAAAVVAWTQAPAYAAWMLTAVAILLAVLVSTSIVFRVRVDEHGFTVASIVGFPRSHVALDDVESVSVVTVNPMGEFGGWGIRYAPGRFGYVLRTGPAIEVGRRGRSSLVVTVDDAETGAALLQALVARSHP